MSEICSSCGAPILWARTERGKFMPLDTEPVLGGKWILSAGGVATISEDAAVNGGGHVPHWATCPDASKHRKSKEKTT